MVSLFHCSNLRVLIHNRFRAHVDRGNVTIDANEWPAFLYDDTMYDPKQEWVGLFLGETFVRVSQSGPSAPTPLIFHTGLHLYTC